MQKARSGKSGLFIFKDELIAFGLISFALFLGASLITYHPHDNSLFYYTSTPSPLHNVGGMMGANIAALFFYVLGSSSLAIVLLLVFCAYLTLRSIPYAQEWERLASGVIGMIVFATLCNAYHIDFFGAQFPGGLIGGVIRSHLVTLFGVLGSSIFLHVLLLMCLILLTRLSFMRVIQLFVKVMHFVLSKRFLVPMYYGTKKVIAVLLMPFKTAIQCIKKVSMGLVVTDEEYSVADFEQVILDAANDGIDNDFMETQEVELTITDDCKKTAILHEEVISKAPAAKIDAAQKIDEPLSELSASQPDEVKNPYRLPQSTLFAQAKNDNQDARLSKELEARAKILEEKLERFGVSGSVTSIKRGPVVTLFEYQPDIDTKVSKIIALADDLTLALQAMSIRIIAPIPGRSVVGFEVANTLRKDVLFASIVKSLEYDDFKGVLPLVLGVDIIGNNIIVDLARMPHLLIAGSTGSGKSVALNAMLISLLCKCKPEELKLILIDPKRLEFASYADIPHLIFPIITESKRATLALRWVVKQMEDRYTMMAACGARNIFDYNALVGSHEKVVKSMPYIVVIIDELADLMMTASRDIEDLIARVAQMARAAGIHMLVATQRPSVDVITGLIKVNFPSRISFRVTSKIDSRTILDTGGADKLLGRGDMLFLDAGGSMLRRVHGAYVSDKEIADVVTHIRAQQAPNYLDLTTEVMQAKIGDDQEDDQIYNDVLSFLKEIDEVSISLLQRKFRIGFNRSARIIEQLESQGLIMSVDGGKTRKVLR